MFNNLEFIASEVQMKLAGGVVTDENRYPLQLLIDSIHAARAWYLAERLSRKLSIPIEYFQVIDCLKIDCIEKECEGIKTGVTEFRVTIPEVVGGVGEGAIKYAGDVNHKHAYSATRNLNFNSVGKVPFVPASNLYYYRLENYLRLKALPTPNMKYFKVVGLFANPSHSLITKCNSESKVYPIPADDIKILKDIITADFINSLVKIRPDLSNDAVPNT